MSKKKVAEALSLVTQGRLDAAVSLLSGVEREFISRRLELEMSSAERNAAAAALWHRLFQERDLPLPAPKPVEVRLNAQLVESTPSTLAGAILPEKLSLDEPAKLLGWIEKNEHASVSLDAVRLAEVWSLVALSTLARQEQPEPVQVRMTGAVGSSRFAYAIGFDDVVQGKQAADPGHAGRTVKLTRVSKFEEVEPTASSVSRLLVPGTRDEDTRKTIYYVLVELLRNVVQHSHDPLGGVVAAQLMDARYGSRDTIQVAVGDAGIGIPAALKSMHPKLSSAREALEKALWPHFSGAFELGLTGTQQNAGMGLFFIAEMTKLLAGKLLIASRGATMMLRGDPDDVERHELKFLGHESLGFPGTLVAFELPIGEVVDYGGLIATINQRAKERTPARVTHLWLSYDTPPIEAPRFVINVASENTVEAQEFALKTLRPALLSGKPIAVDFNNISICTQSYLHALLYEALRLAWALKVKIFVCNAAPAVRSSLELLEKYALGG